MEISINLDMLNITILVLVVIILRFFDRDYAALSPKELITETFKLRKHIENLNENKKKIKSYINKGLAMYSNLGDIYDWYIKQLNKLESEIKDKRNILNKMYAAIDIELGDGKARLLDKEYCETDQISTHYTKEIFIKRFFNYVKNFFKRKSNADFKEYYLGCEIEELIVEDKITLSRRNKEE